jgi:hypothetical protein
MYRTLDLIPTAAKSEMVYEMRKETCLCPWMKGSLVENAASHCCRTVVGGAEMESVLIRLATGAAQLRAASLPRDLFVFYSCEPGKR